MADQVVHILNGDVLKSQVEDWLEGEIIVARECLVDGDDYGHDINSFYQCRAAFISKYDGYKEEDYFTKTVPEIEKIRGQSKDVEVNLWFEDDVFCQINFWFCVYLLHENAVNNIWLIRPEVHTQYGFGGLKKEQLSILFEQRFKLQHQTEIAKLWNYFKVKGINKMLVIANHLKADYPFIAYAIAAWVESLPSQKSPGKPTQILKEIIEELHTEKFEPVFKEFCQRATIYGYGDLQVKILWAKVIN